MRSIFFFCVSLVSLFLFMFIITGGLTPFFDDVGKNYQDGYIKLCLKNKTKEISFKNDYIEVVFSSMGAKLKTIKTATETPVNFLNILRESSGNMGFKFKYKDTEINTNNLQFMPLKIYRRRVVFIARIDKNKYVYKIYSFDRDGIDYEMKLIGLDKDILDNKIEFIYLEGNKVKKLKLNKKKSLIRLSFNLNEYVNETKNRKPDLTLFFGSNTLLPILNKSKSIIQEEEDFMLCVIASISN